jgi:hypothetical protein
MVIFNSYVTNYQRVKHVWKNSCNSFETNDMLVVFGGWEWLIVNHHVPQIAIN